MKDKPITPEMIFYWPEERWKAWLAKLPSKRAERHKLPRSGQYIEAETCYTKDK
jgi:hypothetical protein